MIQTQLELLLKSIFLTFLGMKIVLEFVAFALFYQWQEVTNSRLHRGVAIFIALLISASIMKTSIDSGSHAPISTPSLIVQALETLGWGVFVYVLYKEE
ncbi:MAG: hypothetical protein J7L55_00335 [Desulfurococcales archaeon]|nr:hypothetical protein [Desulfurococcales archaeon]